MAEALTFYWLPHCTTCQKAAAHLEANGHRVAIWRDVKTASLTREEIEQLAAKVGGVRELFSRRARKYRAMNLHERELSTDDLLDLMAQEYTLIKRPVLVQGDRAIAGFTLKAYERFFGED